METNNLAFEVKVIRGLDHTHSESRDGQPNGRKKADLEVAHHLKNNVKRKTIDQMTSIADQKIVKLATSGSN